MLHANEFLSVTKFLNYLSGTVYPKLIISPPSLKHVTPCSSIRQL